MEHSAHGSYGQVDRAHYAPSSPYDDSPQGIGHRATISAPHMHASACESLLPYLKPGAKVLDIGSGSGYLTHVLAELVKPNGRIIGIDHVQELVDLADTNMRKSQEGRSLQESGAAKFVKADGRLGYSHEAPYDAIHVGAAAAEHHIALTDQLKSPGRYVGFHVRRKQPLTSLVYSCQSRKTVHSISML